MQQCSSQTSRRDKQFLLLCQWCLLVSPEAAATWCTAKPEKIANPDFKIYIRYTIRTPILHLLTYI